MAMPARAPALPATYTRPPRIDAAAPEPAWPWTSTRPLIMHSATPQPQLPLTTTWAPSFIPAQYHPTGPSKTILLPVTRATARLWRAGRGVIHKSAGPSPPTSPHATGVVRGGRLAPAPPGRDR